MDYEGQSMKFDILGEYREYLGGVVDNRNTANRYYFAIVKCLKSIQFKELSDISKKQIQDYLVNLKKSNDFSALKNGLKHLGNFDSSFKVPEDSFFTEFSKNKRRGTKSGKKIIELDIVQKKVNALRNKKLKLGFRLMQLSGLRVFELSNLKKQDINISEQIITIKVSKGKGGKDGTIVCDPDKYLSKNLQEYLDAFESDENIFYKAETMKKRARELGLECHDFRRIAAISHRNKLKNEGKSIEEANDKTREFLRHERFSTTKRYLFNRKLKFSSKQKKIEKGHNHERG